MMNREQSVVKTVPDFLMIFVQRENGTPKTGDCIHVGLASIVTERCDRKQSPLSWVNTVLEFTRHDSSLCCISVAWVLSLIW